jgi:hypothetical protein
MTHNLIYTTLSSNGSNIQPTSERHELLSHRSIHPIIQPLGMKNNIVTRKQTTKTKQQADTGLNNGLFKQ